MAEGGNTWIFFRRVKIVDFVGRLGFDVDEIRRFLLSVDEREEGESNGRNTCILEAFGRATSRGTETLNKT